MNANEMYLAMGGTSSGSPAPEPKREPRKAPAGQEGQLTLGTPLLGVVKTTGRQSQPEGTCWDALNVLPYDKTGRKRAAQRTGTSKQFPNRLDTSAITSLNQILVSFLPTVAKNQLLLDETWNYDKGAIISVTPNWTHTASLFNITTGSVVANGYNTGTHLLSGGTISGPGTSLGANPLNGVLVGKFAGSLLGTLSASYSVIFSGTSGFTSVNQHSGDVVGSYIVIGDDATSGKSIWCQITTTNTSSVYATTIKIYGFNNGTISGTQTYTLPNAAQIFSGIIELQITEGGGNSIVNLLVNGTQQETTTLAFIPPSHNLMYAVAVATNSSNRQNSEFSATSTYLQLWNVTTFSAATLPFTETFPYPNGNLTVVSPFWSIDQPTLVPANLYQVTAPGTLTWELANSTNGRPGGVSFKGPLAGLGRQWTVTANVFLELSVPVAAKDACSFHITAGSPSGIAYDLACQFVSPDGSAITPLVVLTVLNKNKVVETQSATPSGVTNTFNDLLELQVDQTQTTTTIRAFWAGVLLFAHTTTNNVTGVSIGWHFLINWTNAALKANVFGFLFSFAIASGLSVPTVNALAHSTLVATCNGFVWLGLAGTASQALQLATGQTVAPLTPGILPGVAGIFEEAYFVDGTHIAQLDIPTAAMVAYAATAGSAPTGTTMACNWRGRLVLAGDPSNPQNFYMSRGGVPTDWDYSQTDPLTAVVGNASTYGQIGEPITSLIPFSDDTMILGCSHSVWMFQGDPADGGTLINISDNMGIVGPRSWCKDTTGNMYFIGTGGLFKLPSTATLYSAIKPTLMSGENWDAFFRSLNATSDYITMTWDSDTHYLHIFVTPSSGGQGTHLIWDERNGGLWPVQYPVSQGPVSMCQYFGDYAANSRSIMLGGWDGYIRKIDETALDDDGIAINAYVVLGPIHLGGEASVLRSTVIDFGELTPTDELNNSGNWNVNVTLAAGPTAYDVTEGTPVNTATISCPLDGRQKFFRQRLRGGWFTLTIANNTLDTYFTFESADLEFTPAGHNRRQR